MPLPGCQRRLPITSHLQAFILIGSGTMDTRQPLILPTTTQGHEHTNTHTQKRNNTIRRSLTHFSGQRGSLYPPANNPVGFQKWPRSGVPFTAQLTRCERRVQPIPGISPVLPGCPHTPTLGECPRAAAWTGTLPALPRTAEGTESGETNEASKTRAGEHPSP